REETFGKIYSREQKLILRSRTHGSANPQGTHSASQAITGKNGAVGTFWKISRAERKSTLRPRSHKSARDTWRLLSQHGE
ncbi:hypothetical protein KI387_025826, partial [Taxus chinensis]